MGQSAGCARCGVRLDGATAFQFQTAEGPLLTCGRCALAYRPMLRRSLMVAAVVGTILLAINQGDVLLREDWPTSLVWKVPLTYLVPFVVATWGALVNGRVRR